MGFCLFRYQNVYFIHYRHYASYPRCLGIYLLGSLRQPGTLTVLKKSLGKKLDRLKDVLSLEETIDKGGDIISYTRPDGRTYDREWFYEIDLDRNIFLVNGIPFFNLECFPSYKVFLEYVSMEDGHRNHYNNFGFMPGCPPRHKYKKPAPRAVADSDLVTCNPSVCVGTHVALSDLLAAGESLSTNEHVWVTLLEMMIGQCMYRGHIDSVFYQFELATDHTQLTNDDWSTACSMANLAFVPQIFDIESRFIYRPQLKRTEFTWVREDIVLCITTYLDDERCLQASVSCLVDAILKQKDDLGVYFGVAFSVKHCAIVKVSKGEHETIFSYTDAFQFLPSFFADSPSTPGIVALARLAYRVVDPALFVHASAVSHWQRPKSSKFPWVTDGTESLAREHEDTRPMVRCPVLPLELWQEIGLHLHVRDLLAFGLVSRVCREAASMVLRYPHVCGFRLVAMNKKPHYPLDPHMALISATFSAIQAGIPANVFIGFDKGTERITIPLNGRGSLWDDFSFYFSTKEMHH